MEKIICSILGNILKYPVHYILVEVSCMQFVCIKNETACEYNLKKMTFKGLRFSYYPNFKSFGPWN